MMLITANRLFPIDLETIVIREPIAEKLNAQLNRELFSAYFT